LIFKEEGMIKSDGSYTAKYFIMGLYYVLTHETERKFNRRKYSMKTSEEAIDPEIIEAFESSSLSNKHLFVGTTKKKSLEWINNELKLHCLRGSDFSKMIIVITDFFEDSSINRHYIIEKVLRGIQLSEKPVFVFKEFREADYIAMIEDDYDEAFSFKHISRHLKKQLQKTANMIGEMKNFQSADKEEVRDYASRSVVE